MNIKLIQRPNFLIGKLLLRSILCYPNKIVIYYGEEGITYKELNRVLARHS